MRERRADAVVVPPGNADPTALRRLTWELEHTRTTLLVGTGLHDVSVGRATVGSAGGTQLVHVRPAELACVRHGVKAVAERILTLLGLIILSLCNDRHRPGHGGDMSTLPEGREETFRRLYAAHFDPVLGYALRRVDRPEDAADITAETFVVAWRRLRHVPPEPDTRPWLFGVARRTLANHRRGEGRRSALGQRLRTQLQHAVADISDEVTHRADVTAALSRLSARDEEVLALHLWEGLEPREIAEVIGLPGAVVRPRLSRAKARLRDLLGNDAGPAGHLQDDTDTAIGPKEGSR